MKKFLGAVSVLALVLLAPSAFAQDAPPADAGAPQQTEGAAPQPDPAPPQPSEGVVSIPPEVMAIINDNRNPGDIATPELIQRTRKAHKLAQLRGLPPEFQGKLNDIAAQGSAELEARPKADAPVPKARAKAEAQAPEVPKADAPPPPDAPAPKGKAPKVEAAPAPETPKLEPAPPPEPPKAEAPKVEAPKVDEPKVEAPKVEVPKVDAPKVEAPKVEAAPAPAALPDAVLALMADNRTSDALSVDELKVRYRSARQYAKDKALPAEVRQRLTDIAASDKTALETMAAQGQPAPPPPPAKVEAPPAPVVTPAPPAKVEAAPAPAVTPPPPKVDAAPVPPAPVVQPPAVPAPAASKTDAPPPPPPPTPVEVKGQPAPTPAQVQALDGNVGDPASEAKAKAYLDDKTDIVKLSDDQLRGRLDGIRDLMSANELSLATERAVRAKLRGESDVLRQRLATAQAAQQQAAPPPPLAPKAPPKPGEPPRRDKPDLGTVIAGALITALTPPEEILRDRRPARDLQVYELQRRIEAYDYARNNPGNYDQTPEEFRAKMEFDRALLRQRMRDERHRREAELAIQAAQDDIYLDEQPYSGPPRRDVYAAEVDQRRLREVLLAPPAPGLRRGYQVNDIANRPELRAAVPRIEIDTIHFGYNESFLRDEELGKLDAIAGIIEKIVKKYPNEVFLIEGHTDAPGSDAYNLALSKKRADSVKQALTTYYVIPARNLRSAGLGERFLKIPTADAEPENRRVSIARITNLLSAQ